MTAPIGADLGRLAAPPGRGRDEEVRFALVDAVVAAKDEGRLTQPVWEEVFGAAARSMRLRVLADAEQEIREAARVVRYPRRLLTKALPDATVADALLQRLLAAGMDLERLAPLPEDAPGRRARAAALDHAWDMAARVADGDRARWHMVAEQIARWRRPRWPLWSVCGLLVAIAIVMSAWLSGEVSGPHWFAPVNDAWWRLWP